MWYTALDREDERKNIKRETNIRIFSCFEGGEIFKRFAKIIIWMMKGNG